MSTNDIGKSRVQSVFVVKETTTGTLAFPVAPAVFNGLAVAGDATLNQVPGRVDSMEKINSLDLIDQFDQAVPAGEWSVPCYMRLKEFGVAPTSPQFAIMLESLMGDANAGATVTAKVNDGGGITDSVTTIPYDDLSAGGYLPRTGVVKIGTEMIFYGGLGTGTLTDCVRGYAGTTAAAHADDADITLQSQVWKLSQKAPSFSLWIKSDHIITFLSGATASNCALSLSNEGAVMMNFSGGGMRMGWAGTSALSADSDATTIVVDHPKSYTVGARIWNETLNDNDSGAGYTVESINYTTSTLTLNKAVTAWKDGNVIAGYLPELTLVGDAVEGRRASLTLAGVAASIRNTELTLDCPKTYPVDQVGVEYPTFYIEDRRTVSTNLNSYFRASDAIRLYDGYMGEDTTMEIVYGPTADAGGKRLVFYAPRVKPTMPSIGFDGPTMALTIPAVMLGTGAGENSFEMYTI